MQRLRLMIPYLIALAAACLLSAAVWAQTPDAPQPAVSGTEAKRYPPPRYAWSDPEYLPFHASIVPCNRNLLGALRRGNSAETNGEDNLKTMKLVYAAYDSARTGNSISLD